MTSADMTSADADQNTGAGRQDPVLAAENLTIRFGGLTALSDVTLQVPPGQVVGLIGPNGAGKSTCLGVLSGMLYPNSGRVYFDSVDVTREPAHRRARRGLGRTFQHVELFAELTVREHLTIAWRRRFDRGRLWRDLVDGRSWRKPPAAETERIDYLLGLLGLSALAGGSVTTLPLGSSRLVEIARSLASSPRVVLLDEPFSGLDAGESAALASALDDVVASEHVALLLVDHDVNTVLARCQQVIVLDAGRLIAAGTSAEIRDNALVRQAYLGDEVVGTGAQTNDN
jgi:branched-chain amino acid transport system ATP-binding protein